MLKNKSPEKNIFDSKTIKKLIYSSLASAYFIQGVTSFLNLSVKLIVSYFLLPEAFGLFAVSLLIISVVNTLRDFGISSHIIREEKVDWGNLTGFYLFTGAMLTILTYNFSFLFSFLSPEIPKLIKIFSIVIIFSALNSVPLSYYSKKIKIQKLILPRILQILTFSVLCVFLAARNFGVYSFIYSKIAAEIVLTLSFYKFFLFRKIRLNFKEIFPFIKRSKYLYMMSIMGILLIDIDKGILSKNASAQMVGYYFLAWSIVFFISKIIEPSVFKVFYPAFSGLKENKKKANRLYAMASSGIMALEVPIYFMLSVCAYDLIKVFFAPQWAPMALIISFLSFLPVIDPFSMLGSELLRSRQKDKQLIAAEFFGLLILILAGNFLTKKYAAIGMVGANFLAHGASLIIIFYVRKYFYGGFIKLLKRCLFIYGAGLVILIIYVLFKTSSYYINLSGALFLILINYFLVYNFLFKKNVNEIAGLIKSKFFTRPNTAIDF